MTSFKPVIIGRSSLRTNTDAYTIAQRPEVVNALGISSFKAQALLHDVLFHLRRHGSPEEITFRLFSKDDAGSIEFRVHTTPTIFTISRDEDVVRVFGSSAPASQSVSSVPAVQASGAGVSVHIPNASAATLHAIANGIEFPQPVQRHEPESAAIEEAAAAKDQAAPNPCAGFTWKDYAPDFIPGSNTKEGLTDAEKAELEKGSDQAAALTYADLDFGLRASMQQLFLQGPTNDGDVISKSDRDILVGLGLVVHRGGYAFLTEYGTALCLEGGIGAEKERWQNEKRRASRKAEAEANGEDVRFRRVFGPILHSHEVEADTMVRRELSAWDGFAGDLDVAVGKQHLDFWIAMSGKPASIAFQYGWLRGLRAAMQTIGVEPKTLIPKN